MILKGLNFCIPNGANQFDGFAGVDKQLQAFLL